MERARDERGSLRSLPILSPGRPLTGPVPGPSRARPCPAAPRKPPGPARTDPAAAQAQKGSAAQEDGQATPPPAARSLLPSPSSRIGGGDRATRDTGSGHRGGWGRRRGRGVNREKGRDEAAGVQKDGRKEWNRRVASAHTHQDSPARKRWLSPCC